MQCEANSHIQPAHTSQTFLSMKSGLAFPPYRQAHLPEIPYFQAPFPQLLQLLNPELKLNLNH